MAAESMLLRCCANKKIYVVKICIYAAITRGKESPQKHVARDKKIINTKLTAVKLLTKQELRKIGSVAQNFYEHAVIHKYTYWVNKYIGGVYMENGKKTGS